MIVSVGQNQNPPIFVNEQFSRHFGFDKNKLFFVHVCGGKRVFPLRCRFDFTSSCFLLFGNKVFANMRRENEGYCLGLAWERIQMITVKKTKSNDWRGRGFKWLAWERIQTKHVLTVKKNKIKQHDMFVTLIFGAEVLFAVYRHFWNKPNK